MNTETLTAYLHLIIFGYFQCLYCDTLRSSVEAAQQHMMGKGHCKFDISSENSKFHEFYDFDSSHEDDDEEDFEISAKRSTVPFVQSDDTFCLLPSGKILSRRFSHQYRLQQHKNRPNLDRTDPQLNSIPPTFSSITSGFASSQFASDALTKVEKRDTAMKNQLLHLRADDLRSLMHMPTLQQYALLATQKK